MKKLMIVMCLYGCGTADNTTIPEDTTKPSATKDAPTNTCLEGVCTTTTVDPVTNEVTTEETECSDSVLVSEEEGEVPTPTPTVTPEVTATPEPTPTVDPTPTPDPTPTVTPTPTPIPEPFDDFSSPTTNWQLGTRLATPQIFGSDNGGLRYRDTGNTLYDAASGFMTYGTVLSKFNVGKSNEPNVEVRATLVINPQYRGTSGKVTFTIGEGVMGDQYYCNAVSPLIQTSFGFDDVLDYNYLYITYCNGSSNELILEGYGLDTSHPITVAYVRNATSWVIKYSWDDGDTWNELDPILFSSITNATQRAAYAAPMHIRFLFPDQYMTPIDAQIEDFRLIPETNIVWP